MLIPSGQNNMNDELFYLLNRTIGGFQWPYISDSGKIVRSIDDAAQFVLILPLNDCDDDDGQDPGFLATIDTETGNVGYYYGSLKGTLDNSFNFPYKWDKLNEASLNGTFSIQYNYDSPLFPYAQTLQFTNDIFTTCDNAAIFCAPFDKAKGFTLGRDVEAQRNPKYPAWCQKLHLAVECVTPNCFVEEQGDQCHSSCTRAATSGAVASAR